MAVIKFIYDPTEVISMHCISSFLMTSSVNIVPDVTFAKDFVYSKYKQVLYDPLDINCATETDLNQFEPTYEGPLPPKLTYHKRESGTTA